MGFGYPQRNLNMKKIFITLLLGFAIEGQAQNLQFNTRIDSVSYLAGQNIAQSILKDFPEANVELLLAGLADAMQQRQSQLTDSANQCVMSYFQEKMQAIESAEQAVNQEALAEKKEEKDVQENIDLLDILQQPSGS